MIRQLHQVIHEIEHGWAGKRLLVVGDLMLDKYICGEVDRISPEAPVPVVHSLSFENRPGGAANVAMNLAHLGAKSAVVGFTGCDESENLLAGSLHSNGISSHFVRSEGFPTITKSRVIGGRQQMLRLDQERLGPRSDEDYRLLIDTALSLLPGVDALVISDYAKGAITPRVCRELIAQARKLGIPIIVDPKTVDFTHYSGATTICPNLRELATAAHLEAHAFEELMGAAEAMAASLGVEFLTVTMSERGIALVRPDSHLVVPAQARQVFDVSGAGDTVVALMGLCLASGFEAETAVQLANLAAGIVVAKVGTVPVRKHELFAALNHRISLPASERILNRDDLAQSVSQWKECGDRIVFTNGCFDLLHAGHITLLERARTLGDRLIVAINSDASVTCLKGPNRPVVSQADRALVLAALTAVDAVVIFKELTPLELILAIQPDVLVKGGDYEAETVVGSTEMKSWGGEVRIVPLVEGFSTTRLLEKSASRHK